MIIKKALNKRKKEKKKSHSFFFFSSKNLSLFVFLNNKKRMNTGNSQLLGWGAFTVAVLTGAYIAKSEVRVVCFLYIVG